MWMKNKRYNSKMRTITSMDQTLKKTLPTGIFLAVLLLFCIVHVVDAQQPTPTLTFAPSQPQFTPADVINAVDNLRVSNGLAPLTTHPVLVQIAQAEANGIATGYDGHWRPLNLTLGQWMLSLGYPLSGDLSLDGYRSENWLSSPISASVDDVIQMWLGDEEHTNTMLSQYRSDIGAAVVVGEDGNVICVIETALQTASGKMQYDAHVILTGVPQTQVAYSDMSTSAAKNGLLPQYSMPVKVSTAQPNGDVYHVVQYGQTLWSIAVTYHTTIKQIQSLNHLSSIMIIDGQKLLVIQGATQLAPTSNKIETPHTLTILVAPSTQFQPSMVQRYTPTPTKKYSAQEDKANALSFGAIVIAALFLGGLFTAMNRKR
jgi:LysM repeat protein